ncbi:acetate/propionate family kinase [Desulfotalea psychrophila]|uniref:Acetate kinase n=1 Tax=Desulfotalea psychrophila (strain LSv54 / DSM 12343) TaxID=177439 RepID=ACKA_DESPS|nr:acetate kinase [Desulfotalea psychrophila]Q6AQT5.1 RecName: Full=Acetate kinase; AltName: Full=Acetokinase [Desulfotalea psychrophila LSv54]CAG35288.1 probable acetate kinase [Desulfotalea psychrophila LSv54]
MKILIINSGSSSIKFQLIDMSDESVLASGLVERIGETDTTEKNINCTFHPGTDKKHKIEICQTVADHRQGMLAAIELLGDKEQAVMSDLSEIDAVGHRIVHGGETMYQPVVVDEKVIAEITAAIPLAPLHNPGHLDGIKVAQELFTEVPHVTVFDTAFFQTIPPHAHIYALPYELYTKHRIRRYGAHGTSHKFVTNECAKLLEKPVEECNLITVHLGNGSSMSAVEGGKAIDTSMGVTPLEGLVMGTRSGDIDPAIMAFLNRNLGMSIEEIDHMLNKESGLKGICGMNDMRDIHAAADAGNELAELAVGIQTYRIRKYIGSYMAALGQVDAIVFTAGIGENDDIVRAKSLEKLENLGVILDKKLNAQRSKEPFCISTPESKIQVWVIPTNEELAIARETKAVVNA